MVLDFASAAREDGSMLELRQHPRFPSLARARLNVAHAEGLLKDLSVTGCRLEFSSTLDVHSGQSCSLHILPEAVSQIGPFDIEAEVRWTRADADSLEIGLAILVSPKGKAFQRYVDYLAWRSS